MPRSSVARSTTSSSSSSRHEREAELLKQRAEDAKRRAELEKREAALFEAEANIERQRRKVLADRRIVEVEALAAEARIEATYASVCGSEFGDTRDPVGFVPAKDLSIPSTTFRNLPGPSRTKVDGGEINTDSGGLECHNRNAGSYNPNVSEPKSSFQDRLNQDIAGALRFSALPKLNMQTFDGNSLYYHQFIRGFDSLFKCVDDPESKFQYLIQCCQEKAYKVVEPCAKIESAEEANNLARERLKKKFGGVQHIVDAHLAQVADGPHIKQDDVASLDRFLVNMESCCLTLSSWNAKDRLNSPET